LFPDHIRNNSTYNSAVPDWVYGLNNASLVAAGFTHSCAIFAEPAAYTNGRIACWGNNSNGQLGIGGTTNRVIPATLPYAHHAFQGGLRH
jgi:hypothetical protein